MTLHDKLFQYSEWLDMQGLIVGDAVSEDKRSHDELATAFLAESEPAAPFELDTELADEMLLEAADLPLGGLLPAVAALAVLIRHLHLKYPELGQELDEAFNAAVDYAAKKLGVEDL